VKNYLQALQFSVDVNGLNNGSPYDHFLLANKLPRAARDGESDQDYAGKLSYLIQGLANPSYVDDESGTFGEDELTGLKIFLARSTMPTAKGAGFAQVGNCVACHAPPHFTDFKFHNTGESQDEYDSLHGPGAFMALEIPSYAQRLSNPENVLPATDTHPTATGSFRTPPSADHPEYADLGAWNILLNSDYAHPQAGLTAIFCPNGTCVTDADRDQALNAAVGAFKTPGIRETGLTDPYLHSGRKITVESVLQFYQQSSAMARAGTIRNGDPELSNIQIDASAVKSLTSFLNSLNEDYE
jgi:cytochrome c peroxidase